MTDDPKVITCGVRRARADTPLSTWVVIVIALAVMFTMFALVGLAYYFATQPL